MESAANLRLLDTCKKNDQNTPQIFKKEELISSNYSLASSQLSNLYLDSKHSKLETNFSCNNSGLLPQFNNRPNNNISFGAVNQRQPPYASPTRFSINSRGKPLLRNPLRKSVQIEEREKSPDSAEAEIKDRPYETDAQFLDNYRALRVGQRESTGGLETRAEDKKENHKKSFNPRSKVTQSLVEIESADIKEITKVIEVSPSVNSLIQVKQKSRPNSPAVLNDIEQIKLISVAKESTGDFVNQPVALTKDYLKNKSVNNKKSNNQQSPQKRLRSPHHLSNKTDSDPTFNSSQQITTDLGVSGKSSKNTDFSVKTEDIQHPLDWKSSLVNGFGNIATRNLHNLQRNMNDNSSVNRRNNLDSNNCSNQEFARSLVSGGGERSSVANSPSKITPSQLPGISLTYDPGNAVSTNALLLGKYKNRPSLPPDDRYYNEGVRKVAQYLHDSFLDQVLCDVAIMTDGGEVLAHQVVLGPYSPTLAALFRQNPSGPASLQHTAQINMADYPRDIVADVINFLYTTDIQLDCRNIGPVLAVARQLDLTAVLEICEGYLIDTCTMENIILHYSVAANNDLMEIRDKLQVILAEGFSEISRHKHFPYIPYDRLFNIFSSPRLCSKEIDIFLGIVRWIDFNRDERQQYAKELLSIVRFQLIDAETLATQVQTVEWLFSDKESRDLISNAYKYHALDTIHSPAVEMLPIQSARCANSANSSRISQQQQQQQQLSQQQMSQQQMSQQQITNQVTNEESNFQQTTMAANAQTNFSHNNPHNSRRAPPLPYNQGESHHNWNEQNNQPSRVSQRQSLNQARNSTQNIPQKLHHF